MGNKYIQMLAAILAGNIVFFTVSHFLPEHLQHSPFAFDLGLLLDFLLCFSLWIWIRTKFAERNAG